MSNECLKALQKYFDPDNPAYEKRIHWNWIEQNFTKKDIELYKKEALLLVMQSKKLLIEEQAKEISKGVGCTSTPLELFIRNRDKKEQLIKLLNLEEMGRRKK